MHELRLKFFIVLCKGLSEKVSQTLLAFDMYEFIQKREAFINPERLLSEILEDHIGQISQPQFVQIYCQQRKGYAMLKSASERLLLG